VDFQELPITYPDLPITLEKQRIIQAIKDYPVIIVAGETGSGKTTQLPKFCLEAGLGRNGIIGHTQPRRIAARSVAMRIAAELKTPLGTVVGYKVRFSDKTQASTRIKVMTDGILLSELQQKKSLPAYDCLIIDEAHERSLNIDFILGYLKTLLTKRADLKVLITSATIDVERFSQFFNDAPIFEISGRSYPVEVVHLPPEMAQAEDPALAVLSAVDMACMRGSGDILIFLSGEKEIREVMEVLTAHHPTAKILPLYSRLSVSDQQKVFQEFSARKIIVTTNVAETSLTVPNIRFVIDAGLARVSRYNYRNKLQRLPIEPISQASCEQRMGRCGRVGPGICYRLYTKEDYLSRPIFTEPEILRTNLAGVILKMLALGIKKIESFPFIEPPDNRFIKDGFTLLERLGAVSENRQITRIGKVLANIPIEPKLGRMMIAANHYGALQEILIIVSALSIVDPRERPQEFIAKADLAHKAFQHESSDFMSFLKLWEFLHVGKNTLSHNQFRKYCRTHFLSYIRVCEWFDVYQQLEDLAKELGFKKNQVAADYSLIHKSLLTGLLDTIGMKEDKKEYLGARNIKFTLHPASALFKKSPQWVMACEIVHTSKNYARTNAKIETPMIEEVGKAFLKRQYFEPHFDEKEGRVVAFEKATLFGLEIISKRKMSYDRLFPVEARAIFIRAGLVAQKLTVPCAFYHKNIETVKILEDIEHRARGRLHLLDEERIYQFYEQHLPPEIYSARALMQVLKGKEDAFLTFTQAQISADKIDKDFFKNFPDVLYVKGYTIKLSYKFDLRAQDDGVTALIPLAGLPFLKEADFSCLVPGLAEDLTMHFAIVNDEDTILAKGDDLKALYEPLKDALPSEILEEYTQWDFGDCPFEKGPGYCALTDKQTHVSIQVFATAQEAQLAHALGLCRMYLYYLTDKIKYFKQLHKKQAIFVQWADDIIFAGCMSVFVVEAPNIRTYAQFAQQLKQKQPHFIATLDLIFNLVKEIVSQRVKVQALLKKYHAVAVKEILPALADIERQMAELLPPHFIKDTPLIWLKRLPVYLKGILLRLEKLPRQVAQDKQHMMEVNAVRKAYANKLASMHTPDLAFRWKIEELSLSLFAQSLGTLEPVSKIRLLKQLDKLTTK